MGKAEQPALLILVGAQPAWLGALVLAVIAGAKPDEWFTAWFVSGQVFAVLTVLAALSCRQRFLGRAVLALEALGAGAGALVVLVHFLLYAAGWGGRTLAGYGGDADWSWELAVALVWFSSLGAAAGTMAGVLVSTARALWMRR